MQGLPRILLVEDDRGIAHALTIALRGSYDITTANSGKIALHEASSEQFDVIVLDLTLPDMPGITICERLRERGIAAPILVLSAENRILTKILLLDAGANDYLTKPFSLGELKARLRVLDRAQQPLLPQLSNLIVGCLELNREAYQVIREGITINLRRKEFALLECLMQHADAVVSREALTRSVWHERADVWTNTIDVHIKHLRDKIDRPFSYAVIKTVHGRGYKLNAAHIALVDKD